MRPRNLILLLICALLTFGGSFTCHAESGGDEFTKNPSTGVK